MLILNLLLLLLLSLLGNGIVKARAVPEIRSQSSLARLRSQNQHSTCTFTPTSHSTTLRTSSYSRSRAAAAQDPSRIPAAAWPAIAHILTTHPSILRLLTTSSSSTAISSSRSVSDSRSLSTAHSGSALTRAATFSKALAARAVAMGGLGVDDAAVGVDAGMGEQSTDLPLQQTTHLTLPLSLHADDESLEGIILGLVFTVSSASEPDVTQTPLVVDSAVAEKAKDGGEMDGMKCLVEASRGVSEGRLVEGSMGVGMGEVGFLVYRVD